ncbi:hypothetical protein NM688_g2244 [Phlebia brevispora]|uniref:Uncharacterized protein n=1 Tax=Phlebia brevispora TaxID=194682 RepID=A0ACC1T9F0_9APHY|nr:hypothetical protein NM688_g2244 [Phlebia brevispora]
MRLLPPELGLLILLLPTAGPVLSARALPHVSLRDETLPCTGNLAPLNTNGQSPGSIYEQLQSECNNVANTDASLCKCNLIVYNIKMASIICEQDQPSTWPEWAQSNLCPNSTSSPPTEVPYDTGSITIPKWAHEDLSSSMTFNLSAALKEAKGWSGIQIATPIITSQEKTFDNCV